MNIIAEVTMTDKRTLVLPDEVYELLAKGKQVSIELKGEQILFREAEAQKSPVSEEKDFLKIDRKGFAERTQSKTFDELLHERKREAQRLLEDQGIASMALYISEMMVRSIELERKHTSG